MHADAETLYRRHAPAVWRFVRVRVPTPQDAEDVASDVFARAVNTDSYDPMRGSEIAWLMGIARNATADWWRRRRPEDAVDEVPETAVGDVAAQTAETRDEVSALHRHLATLSARERDAIALRFGAELSSADIGEQLGISATAARMLVHRAVTKLRGAMGHE